MAPLKPHIAGVVLREKINDRLSENKNVLFEICENFRPLYVVCAGIQDVVRVVSFRVFAL